MSTRRSLKIAGYALGGVVALMAVAIPATVGVRPFLGPRARPLTARTFATTPERLARGEYLVHAVTGCLACHSDHDTGAGVPDDALFNGAGKVWTFEGMPWLVAPNLTSDEATGAGTWSDDALARAIREGIGHDGRALFPVMPYESYRVMSDEDLASIVVYFRRIEPVRRAVPATEVPFPPGPLINNIPEPLEHGVTPPGLNDPVTRGEYLVALGACRDCHTPMNDRGERLAGLEFAGGFVMRDSKGDVAGSNLTPDPSGIPYYTEELFLDTMRTGRVIARELRNVMPWWVYRHMTDADLKAIYAYLRTLKPVQHRVDNTQPPTDCTVCGLSRGGGDQNQARTTGSHDTWQPLERLDEMRNHTPVTTTNPMAPFRSCHRWLIALTISFVAIAAIASPNALAQTTAAQPPARGVPAAPPDVAAAPPDAEQSESGLVSKVITAGTGTTHPGPADTVVVNYTGWRTNGALFDSTALRGEPTTVRLTGVLPGWTEGLQLMVEGETRRFWIPQELAFRGVEGRPEGTVVFEIELLEIRSALAAAMPQTPEDLRRPPRDARRSPSGLIWKVLRPGTGTVKPYEYSRVTVHYSGWMTDGNMFDSSVAKGQPLTTSLAEVMAGWREGLQQMVEGEIRRFWIPERLAYAGLPGRPSGTLVFDVELIEIVER